MFDPSGFAGNRLYLDANVFIYSIEGFAPYDAFLRDLFALVEDRTIRAATSEITIAEVMVLPLRQSNPRLIAIYEELLAADGPIDVLPISRAILLQSAEVRARSSSKLIDAIHIATAIEARSDILISDDRRLNPAPVLKMTLEDLANG